MCFSKLESFLVSRSTRFYFLALLIIAAATLLPRLGTRGLNSLQELRVAQVAREMVENSDYIRPHYLGSYRFQKPPLAYWVCAASYKALGRIDEFSARFPFALLSIAGAVVFFFLMTSAFSGRVAFISSLALISFNEYIQHARSCRIDNLLVFFLLSSAFLFYEGRARKKHWLYIAVWAVAGFAFLAKGLAAVLFCAAVLPLVFVFSRDWAGLKKFLFWSVPGFCIFVLISSSWYIAMLVFDPEAWTIMRRELAVLVDSSRHANYFFYYCYQTFASLFPGFAFCVPALVLLRKNIKTCQLSSLMLVWFGVFFVVLSCMTNKQPHYTLLLSVPVAGMAGWFIDRLIAGAALPGWTMRWTDFVFYLSTVTVVIAVPVANIAFAHGYLNYEPLSWGGAGCGVWCFGTGRACLCQEEFVSGFYLSVCVVVADFWNHGQPS